MIVPDHLLYLSHQHNSRPYSETTEAALRKSLQSSCLESCIVLGTNEGSFFGSQATTPSYHNADASILKQLKTRPITQEQLVNEVKGIYVGLVMVEKKCVEICQQRSLTTNSLTNELWQALISLHRTLLHEHHDSFLTSQHPTTSPALRRLATKYATLARIWRQGIHLIGVLMESVPSFVETWIECLGDLARYRMVIEEVDPRDREIWSNVARMWYIKATDKSSNVGS